MQPVNPDCPTIDTSAVAGVDGNTKRRLSVHYQTCTSIATSVLLPLIAKKLPSYLHFDNRPSTADTILSAMAPETKCFKDRCKCFSLTQYQRQPPAERSYEWPVTSIQFWASLPWSYSRSDAVIQGALAKDFRQAKESKQPSVQTRRLAQLGAHRPAHSIHQLCCCVCHWILLSCLVEIQPCRSCGLPTQ